MKIEWEEIEDCREEYKRGRIKLQRDFRIVGNFLRS